MCSRMFFYVFLSWAVSDPSQLSANGILYGISDIANFRIIIYKIFGPFFKKFKKLKNSKWIAFPP